MTENNEVLEAQHTELIEKNRKNESDLALSKRRNHRYYDMLTKLQNQIDDPFGIKARISDQNRNNKTCSYLSHSKISKKSHELKMKRRKPKQNM